MIGLDKIADGKRGLTEVIAKLIEIDTQMCNEIERMNKNRQRIDRAIVVLRSIHDGE